MRLISIDNNSRVHKYQQLIDSLEEKIINGELNVGDRIPSINRISEDYHLSRDTVEKAFTQLKKRKVIRPIKGIGYFINKKPYNSNFRILYILDKWSDYKMEVFNAFVEKLGKNGQVDLNFYYGKPSGLLKILEENVGVYDYYVLVPHFIEDNLWYPYTKRVIEMLKTIPADKLIIVNNGIPDLGNDVPTIYQDYKNDIYQALKEGETCLRKYNKLVLVFSSNAQGSYPHDIICGFKKFCQDFNFNGQVLETLNPDTELEGNAVIITVEETDLVILMRQVREQGLTLGKDIGVISYNDSPSKELLNISVMSTDFKAMGETTANMIRDRKKEVVKNAFRFINRGSV